jgi:oligopeptide/dipeptide ABC transporter ATP-binding protein
MYLGSIVEIAKTEELVTNPLHPYSKALIAAVPVPNPTRKRRTLMIRGEITKPIDLPSGCRFRTRCFDAQQICSESELDLAEISSGHEVSTWFRHIMVWNCLHGKHSIGLSYSPIRFFDILYEGCRSKGV